MKATEAVKKVNENYGNRVFKPGYPTARLEYMVAGEGKVQKAVAEEFARLGVEMTRSPCGHDYNYGGDLYRLRPAEQTVRAKSQKESPHNQDAKEISK